MCCSDHGYGCGCGLVLALISVLMITFGLGIGSLLSEPTFHRFRSMQIPYYTQYGLLHGMVKVPPSAAQSTAPHTTTHSAI